MDFVTILEILFGVTAILVALRVVFGGFFTVPTASAGIVQRFGKFHRVANDGLNFKIPLIDSVKIVSLKTGQMTDSMETKTKDNVFVTFPVSVQWQVDPGAIRDAYYKSANPSDLIKSFLRNSLLGHIPEMDLDEVFVSQPKIGVRATSELAAAMAPYGYRILQVLITDVVPDAGVKAAMNRINEEMRNKTANEAQGEAEKVLEVKRAEAEAQVKKLNGEGIAMEREAIAKGWQQSIETVKDGTELDDKDATFLLLFTNWTDMLKEVGGSENSTLVFMPPGPDGLTNFQQTMTNTLLSGRKQVAGNKSS